MPVLKQLVPGKVCGGNWPRTDGQGRAHMPEQNKAPCCHSTLEAGGGEILGGGNFAGKISLLRKMAKFPLSKIFAVCDQQIHCEFRCG